MKNNKAKPLQVNGSFIDINKASVADNPAPKPKKKNVLKRRHDKKTISA